MARLTHSSPKADPQQIRQALDLLAAPGQVVELRALDAVTTGWRRPHTVSGYFDRWEPLAEAAADLKARGIYITLNPVAPALLARAANRVRDLGAHDATTSDGDILERRWLPIDCDPVRPAGISASDVEHELALTQARAIRDHLQAQGWPAPLLADSGNGGHLLYRVAMPAADDGLIEGALRALAFQFDDEAVIIDQRVGNPARIWKLYGTVARKGDHTPERPYRLARLLEVPPVLAPVSGPQLAALGALLPQAPAAPGLRAAQGRSGPGFDLEGWLRDYGLAVTGPRPWQAGHQRWIFPICPWNPAHRRSAYIVRFANGALAAGCHHNSCAGNDWHALRDLFEPGWRDRKGRSQGNAGPDQTAGGADPTTDHPPIAAADILSELARLAPAGGKPERGVIEAGALDLVARCARLSKTDRLRIASTLRNLGCTAEFVRRWLAAIAEAPAPSPPAAPDPQEEMPYVSEGGRMYHRQVAVSRAGEIQARRTLIADFTVRIVEEARGEDGRVWFGLDGQTAAGEPVKVEIAAGEFADDRVLQAALTQAAGARSPVRAGMAKHLRPAIQLLTNGDLRRVQRFDRTGWRDGQTAAGEAGSFLIPGREPEGVIVRLPRKLPYAITADADIEQGLTALDAALTALAPSRTTVVAAALFQAPLARLAGWRGERYGVFVAGRSGSLKTSVLQVLMCIYGANFLGDEYLLKLGEGATRNAIVGYAASAHDLPFLVDNYKPNTGDGSRGFVNLIHNLLEGGERERMTRTAELRETRPIFCWPVFTGEDVPAGDAAGLARLLVVPFEWPHGEENARLTLAQELAGQLPAVGAAWLDWLESEAGRACGAEAAAQFPQVRRQWVQALLATRADMVNPLRVASNLASNQLTWAAVCRHPQLGLLAKRYAEEHRRGLAAVAGEMARRTAQSVEAARFLEVLRELLATDRCVLAPRGQPEHVQPERLLGWRAADGSAYLVPALARREVERVLGPDGLNGISSEALYAQLNGLDLLASHDRGRLTRKLRTGRSTQNVLHLRAAALEIDGPADAADDPA